MRVWPASRSRTSTICAPRRAISSDVFTGARPGDMALVRQSLKAFRLLPLGGAAKSPVTDAQHPGSILLNQTPFGPYAQYVKKLHVPDLLHQSRLAHEHPPSGDHEPDRCCAAGPDIPLATDRERSCIDKLRSRPNNTTNCQGEHPRRGRGQIERGRSAGTHS